jgi:hypothetical protein
MPKRTRRNGSMRQTGTAGRSAQVFAAYVLFVVTCVRAIDGYGHRHSIVAPRNGRAPRLSRNLLRPVRRQVVPGARHIHQHVVFVRRPGKPRHRAALFGVPAVVFNLLHNQPLGLFRRKSAADLSHQLSDDFYSCTIPPRHRCAAACATLRETSGSAPRAVCFPHRRLQ